MNYFVFTFNFFSEHNKDCSNKNTVVDCNKLVDSNDPKLCLSEYLSV